MREWYQILNNRMYRDFIRMNPVWYKELNRDPSSFGRFVEAMEEARRQNEPDRLETVDKHLNTAKAMMKLISNVIH